MKKPFCAFGQAGRSAIREFLRHTALWDADQTEVAFHCQAEARASAVLAMLRHGQAVRSDQLQIAGDIAGAIERWRELLQVIRQVLAADESLAGWLVQDLQAEAVLNILQIAKKHPDVLSNDERHALRELEHAALTRRRVLEAAEHILNSDIMSSSDAAAARQTTVAVNAACGSWPAILFASGLLGLLAAHALQKTDAPRSPAFGAWRHVVSWATGIGLSVLIFGLAPVRLLSESTQQWGLYVIGWLPFAAIIIWIAYLGRGILDRHRDVDPSWLQFLPMIGALWMAALVLFATWGRNHFDTIVESTSTALKSLPPPMATIAVVLFGGLIVLIISMLIRWIGALVQVARQTGRAPISAAGVIGVLAVATGFIWPAVTICGKWISAKAVGITIPLRDLWGIPSEWIWTIHGIEERSWQAAVWQWMAYSGLPNGLAAGLGIVAGWHWLRLRQIPPQEFSSSSESRLCGKGPILLAGVSRSALGLAYCCLLLDLITAPTVLRTIDRSNRYKRPHVFAEQFATSRHEAIKAIQSDEEIMRRIQREVAEELAKRKMFIEES